MSPWGHICLLYCTDSENRLERQPSFQDGLAGLGTLFLPHEKTASGLAPSIMRPLIGEAVLVENASNAGGAGPYPPFIPL
jgi:hypothetical protein